MHLDDGLEIVQSPQSSLRAKGRCVTFVIGFISVGPHSKKPTNLGLAPVPNCCRHLNP